MCLWGLRAADRGGVAGAAFVHVFELGRRGVPGKISGTFGVIGSRPPIGGAANYVRRQAVLRGVAGSRAGVSEAFGMHAVIAVAAWRRVRLARRIRAAILSRVARLAMDAGAREARRRLSGPALVRTPAVRPAPWPAWPAHGAGNSCVVPPRRTSRALQPTPLSRSRGASPLLARSRGEAAFKADPAQGCAAGRPGRSFSDRRRAAARPRR